MEQGIMLPGPTLIGLLGYGEQGESETGPQ